MRVSVHRACCKVYILSIQPLQCRYNSLVQPRYVGHIIGEAEMFTCFDLCSFLDGQVGCAKDDRKASCRHQVYMAWKLHHTTLFDHNLASKSTTLRNCAHLQIVCVMLQLECMQDVCCLCRSCCVQHQTLARDADMHTSKTSGTC